MNKKPSIKKAFVVLIIIFLLIVSLCGCTEYKSSETIDKLSKFFGTWSGNMEFSMFNYTDIDQKGNMSDFRNISSANITNLEFTADNLYMTILMRNETQIISYTYMTEGNNLVLTPKFNRGPSDGEFPDGENPFNSEPPNNRTRPPFDGENPYNESNPFYHEQPNNDTRPTFDGEQPFRKSSYNYEFNEELNILYLDGSPFIKN